MTRADEILAKLDKVDALCDEPKVAGVEPSAVIVDDAPRVLTHQDSRTLLFAPYEVTSAPDDDEIKIVRHDGRKLAEVQQLSNGRWMIVSPFEPKTYDDAQLVEVLRELSEKDLTDRDSGATLGDDEGSTDD